MNNLSNKVSLKKSEPWTDPVSGEIYPGGNPNTIPQPQPTFSQNVSTYPSNSPNAVPYPSNSSAPDNVGYSAANEGMKFCKFCGQKIPADAVICVKCGRQVEQLQGAQSGQAPTQVYINNSPNVVTNNNVNAHLGRPLTSGWRFCCASSSASGERISSTKAG